LLANRVGFRATVDAALDLAFVVRRALRRVLELFLQIAHHLLGCKRDRQTPIVELRTSGTTRHLVVLGRRQHARLLLDELAQRRKHDRARRQVDARCDRLRRHDELDQPLERECLDELLVARKNAGVMNADAVPEQRTQLLRAPRRQQGLVAELVDLGLLLVGREAPAGLQ
jgi:hypothetical protein